MFNAVFFARMKRGALFINISRGESVVTDDLVAALRSGHLGGAGLDVTAPEPLPPGHPLWSMPNVVITPHSGGASDQVKQRLLVLAVENLRRYVAGERMISVVDLQRLY
jgi:phosphoglycerate dehydrogenase-like enzyme